MHLDLPRLRHIVAIARTRSFSRAAEELHITQPALSRSIATFEQGFGIRLFDRGRGGVSLTTTGRLVVEEAERLLRSARDFEHNLALYGTGETGRIDLGLGPLAASLILPRLSTEILRGGSTLQIRASVKPAEEMLRTLLDDEIEVIFANRWRLPPSPEIAVTPVGSIRLAMIVRGGHPLCGSGPLSLADLRAFPVANAVELPIAGLTGEAGAFVCDNYHILRETTLGTDCVWLASPDLLDEDMAAGRLVALDVPDFAPAQSDIAMIRRRGRSLSPAAELVARTVQDICAG